jgi:hypothetical protein
MDEIISYKMCRSKNAQCKTAGIFYFVAIDDWRLEIADWSRNLYTRPGTVPQRVISSKWFQPKAQGQNSKANSRFARNNSQVENRLSL